MSFDTHELCAGQEFDLYPSRKHNLVVSSKNEGGIMLQGWKGTYITFQAQRGHLSISLFSVEMHQASAVSLS